MIRLTSSELLTYMGFIITQLETLIRNLSAPEIQIILQSWIMHGNATEIKNIHKSKEIHNIKKFAKSTKQQK